jgi:UDP-N-acetylglucosamine--N-acetylmuramyl-(pentapeptide) pyrophosphoryl-undecaprenol N-acetylglucosamine transferase
VVNVGNPVRKSFDGLTKEQARKQLGIPDCAKFVILSFGGSLGAPRINEAAIDVMREFCAKHLDVMHFHSGGKNYYDNAMQMFAGYSLEKNERLDIREYIYDMALHMIAADVVICRAGAMTLTELAMMKKPAILIPSPNVTDNHQYKNAKALADKGAAILLEERDLNCESIVEAVSRVWSDAKLRADMSEAISAFANKDVNEQIYGEIEKAIKNKAKIERRE